MEKMPGKSGFFVARERERERENEMYFIQMKLYDIICCCISCTNNIVKRKTHYYYEVYLNELLCVYEITSIRAKSCFFLSIFNAKSRRRSSKISSLRSLSNPRCNLDT